MMTIESRFGEDRNTYRKNYRGGVWQVDKIGFEDTQKVKSHRKLEEKLDKIEKHFG